MNTDNVVEFPHADPDLAEEARIAAAIVAGIRNGSGAAENNLVERYSRGLRFLLIRRVGDAERASDLLQETLCIAIEKLREIDLDNPERLAGYLRGIAVRVAMNANRKRQREPASMDIDEVATVVDHQPRQFELVSRHESALAIRRLLGDLPVKRDREVLIRYYVNDEDKEAICASLDLSSLHFNRVLFRAKARFRKLLEEGGALNPDTEVPDR